MPSLVVLCRTILKQGSCSHERVVRQPLHFDAGNGAIVVGKGAVGMQVRRRAILPCLESMAARGHPLEFQKPGIRFLNRANDPFDRAMETSANRCPILRLGTTWNVFLV